MLKLSLLACVVGLSASSAHAQSFSNSPMKRLGRIGVSANGSVWMDTEDKGAATLQSGVVETCLKLALFVKAAQSGPTLMLRGNFTAAANTMSSSRFDVSNCELSYGAQPLNSPTGAATSGQ